MTLTYLSSINFKASQWSGGSTTELFIFPATADYKKGDYDFRLSTATVEVESSDFTPLLGVSRTLMVLSGNMNLDHDEHHSSQLGKFDVDKFSGGWNTVSKGKCTDFNLMTLGHTVGDQRGLDIQKDQVVNFPVKDSWDWVFFYAYSGTSKIDVCGKQYPLKKGDLLVIKNPQDLSLQIEGVENSELVICNIDN